MKKRDPILTIRALITAAEALFTQKGIIPSPSRNWEKRPAAVPLLFPITLEAKRTYTALSWTDSSRSLMTSSRKRKRPLLIPCKKFIIS